MSRQKVPDDKRQRTAQACDYCKRRKQKCNGVKPCSTCAKKNVSCTYTTGNTQQPDAAASDPAYASSSKRRHADISGDPNTGPSSSVSSSTRGATAAAAAAAASTTKSSTHRLSAVRTDRESNKAHSWDRKKNVPFELELEFPTASTAATSNVHTLEDHTRASTTSGNEEEAVLEHTTRLLKDQTGRMLYIGDSATLAYLHLLRRMVESISGQSDFTTDPSKGNIVENVVDLPLHIRPPSMLADRQTANVLVESFFTNTSGLVEIFDRDEFLTKLDACYDSPLSASNDFLCLLFLTFAIGLVMATPEPDTKEYAIVQSLDNKGFDQAELFFRSAKCLCDPLSGLEDADFWSIQALCLIAIYMLAVSKRNAAFAYHSMAVRSAVALGLHRQEAMANFKGSELNARRNIWKSLYMLDRFIAASLGRPSAINEDECTADALEDAFELHIPPIFDQYNQQQGHNASTASCHNPAFKATEVHELGVNATVRSCRIIGNILKKLYARRRVSIRATGDIVQQCRTWTKDLHECLRWNPKPPQASSTDASLPKPKENSQPPRAHSIAILHVNLVYCHSVILLTRPFFLYVIHANRRGANQSIHPNPRTNMFSEVCVAASYHTIAVIKGALDAKCLPRRNPFVMYFLFTAALLVMSNEFVALFRHPDYEAYATDAITLMEYFSKADSQSRRLLWILRELQKVVAAQARLQISRTVSGTGPRAFHHSYPLDLINCTRDPISLFFEEYRSMANLPVTISKQGRLQVSEIGGNTIKTSDGGDSSQVAHASQGGGRVGVSYFHRPGNTAQSASTASFASSNQSRNLIGLLSADTTSPNVQHQSPSALRQSQLQLSQSHSQTHTQPHSQSHAQTAGYNESSPSLHPPVLPPPYPAQSHSISYSPGHGNAGGGNGGGGSSLGLSINFGGGYGHPAFAGVVSGNAPANVTGFYQQIPTVGRTGSGDPDGSDSMGTDTEGFDLDLLWQWPDNNAVSMAAGAEVVAMATSGVSMVGTALATAGGHSDHGSFSSVSVPITDVSNANTDVSSYLVGGERGPPGRRAKPVGSDLGSSLSSKPQGQGHGPMPTSPLPPIYATYSNPNMPAGGIMTTPQGGSLMHASMTAPLYHTADHY